MSRVSRFMLVLVAALAAPIADRTASPIAAQAPSAAPFGRWTEARAAEWYRAQPWLVGANYVPATAINELEMWQADTFDPARIDLELGWAAAIGMNTMRVFLHDLAYGSRTPQGFLRRVDQFLAIAAKHRIRPMLVLFDSVWDPIPGARAAARADAGRAQFRLGAEPRQGRARGSGAVAAARGLRQGRRRRLQGRSRGCSRGTSGTSSTT